ncbi:hypothetical protein C8A03DRAFT_11521 [Achaetomium macrosporum]|uniref:Mitochondrial seryl-tRNA synthetase n=1 Tax=Achaetomium macrosporum TaxID=79813 RepID=A0AAN7CJ26_9PEZI|nr:hypothetical protein C8A03DRAFT_11521 [Achaetomium macrosporum]
MRPLLESLAAVFRPPLPHPTTTTSPRQRHAFAATARNARVRLQTAKPRSRRSYRNNSNPSSSPKVDATTSSSATTQAETATRRAERILSHLPRPLQRYATRLRGAPLTHVAAFLVLHEITAVVPLLGLFGLFHYAVAGAHLPVEYLMRNYGGYVEEGVGRFERYFRRKGWFGFGNAEDGGGNKAGGKMTGRREGAGQGGGEEVLQRWREHGGKVDDPKYRVVVEVALAYTITKVLLPVRILASVWATPWFAGVLIRLGRIVRRGG